MLIQDSDGEIFVGPRVLVTFVCVAAPLQGEINEARATGDEALDVVAGAPDGA